MPSKMIESTYVATRPDRDPAELAESIAREQSLEIIPELIPQAVGRRLLGRVRDVRQLDDRRWALRIGYPAELAGGQIGALVQLVYGNVSFYPRVRLAALKLPDGLLAGLPGPLGGLAAVRRLAGVDNRALLMTVLKPRGSAPEQLAGLARRFAVGGGDVLKDDQNLVESDPQEFAKRIRTCAQSIEKAADITGKRCLYLPHVAGSGEHLQRQLEAVAETGLAGVVMCPWIMGLESAAAAARSFGLMWLAHPALAGALTEPADTGVATEVLLGTLVRAAGADISVFPGRGGRIAGRHDDELATCRALTGPLGNLHPALPCIGGGKRVDEAAAVSRRLGPDCAVLIGGDLLKAEAALEEATRATIAAIAASTAPG